MRHVKWLLLPLFFCVGIALPTAQSSKTFKGRIAPVPIDVSMQATIAGTGSILEVEVVPTVATTQNGKIPLRLSSSIASLSASTFMRKSLSDGIFLSARWPKPRVIIPLSIEECAWSEA